jgi:hypothetical protein
MGAAFANALTIGALALVAALSIVLNLRDLRRANA